MNLLCTSVGNFQTFEFQDHLTLWKEKGHIIELMPMERIRNYLAFDPSSSLAQIDAIVCAADTNMIAFDDGTNTHVLDFPVTKALILADEIRQLPDSCAMRDGRKWRSIPFIILSNPGNWELTLEEQRQSHSHFPFYRHPHATLRQILRIVEQYQMRVLNDYHNFGIVIRFQYGQAQIGPALLKKDPAIESEFYYAPADRRRNRNWVTIKRDSEGQKYETELFERLIDQRVTEQEMHHFFEEHPSFLMEARLGIPISHQPNFAQPKDWKPDFSFSPILGPSESKAIELMELKGPGENTLSRTNHRGFSAKVHAAIDQVRDYNRCLRDPSNSRAIEKALGYIPDESRMAVLIGRTPANPDREIFAQRQSELDVKVITYDEILQTQVKQLYPNNWS